MHINNPDALKSWLSLVLEPLCDADPNALARYVLALLKKDKPINDLRVSMQDQLDVFLGAETAPFLERLFKTLEVEKYVSPSDLTGAAEKENVKTEGAKVRESTPPIDNTKDPDTISISPFISETIVSPSSQSSSTATVATPKAPRSDEQARDTKRKRRSRSRSFERLKRSKSRDRRSDYVHREKNIQKYRNKSPPAATTLSSRRRQHLDGRRHRSQSGSRSRSVSPDTSKKPSRSTSPTVGLASTDDQRSKKSQRCRDFDEKGYCMRGETCPWDHGVDPVVLEDLNNPSLLALPGPPRPMMSEYSPYAPEMWNRGPRGGPNFGGRMPPPGFKGGPGGQPFPFPLNAALSQVSQRELIPVPVIGERGDGDLAPPLHMPKRRFDGDDQEGGGVKRKPPISSRLGARVPNQGQQNCSLELRKVPRGLNAIAHLNNHFSKFGKITNIQISYDGDPEAAIVTFSSHAEANVAYRSTEAVLNNRFIKVFWHTPSPNAGSDAGNAKPDGVRKNQYHINHKTSDGSAKGNAPSEEGTGVANMAAIGKNLSLVNNAQTPAQTPAVPRMTNPKLKREVAQLARKQKENAVQVACGLTKKKQSLLEGYIQQMSSMVDLLSRTDLTETQKNTYMVTIKELETKINELKKEISSEHQRLAQVQPQIRKTKEQKQKELLDVELDLITQEHDGNDAVAIQRKLKEIQKSINAVSTKARPRQVVPRGSTTIDRRPTTIHVTGFDVEDSDALVGHFKHFGEIAKNLLDKSVPYLVISYATRLNAEQAMQRGATFKDKTLRMMWVTQKEEPAAKPEASTTADVERTNVIGVAVEDEEETEEEERSWRR